MCVLGTEGPGELGLRAGDIVSMVEQVDSEWYRGTCKGSTGFFPVNYVNVLVNVILVHTDIICITMCQNTFFERFTLQLGKFIIIFFSIQSDSPKPLVERKAKSASARVR